MRDSAATLIVCSATNPQGGYSVITEDETAVLASLEWDMVNAVNALCTIIAAIAPYLPPGGQRALRMSLADLALRGGMAAEVAGFIEHETRRMQGGPGIRM